MNKLLIALLGMALAGAAAAKLPPPSPEAQAKADEAKHKAAWSGKVAAYKLCQAQDRIAEAYRNKAKDAPPKADAAAAGAAPAVPPCEDPGPYVAASASARVGVADSLPVPAAGKPPAPAEEKK